MAWTFVENTNNLVDAGDTLIIVGDIVLWQSRQRERELIEIVRAITCTDIRFVEGNHDHCHKWSDDLRSCFTKISQFGFPRRLDGLNCIISHYPIAGGAWKGYGNGIFNYDDREGYVNLHGHRHSPMPGSPPWIDIGVDAWEYCPVSLSEIKSYCMMKIPEK
jgi:calcineurin-like phosphoesterase family protein